MRFWNYIPAKRSRVWLFLFIPVSVIITLLIIASSILSLKLSVGAMDILIITIISLIGSLAICGFGYAGLRIAFISCVAGVIAGVLCMTYVFNQSIQWPGIAGLVSGVQTAFLFFLVGVNLQMISVMLKRRRR